jgi:hypothetical protein
MKFKPFGNQYDFTKETLIKSFPDYFVDPLDTWLWNVLKSANVAKVSNGYYSTGDRRYLTTEFINRSQIFLREVIPQHWNEFVNYVFSNEDRTANIIALCLQNFANANDAVRLEIILSQGGSGYEVTTTDKGASEYAKGVYDLIERVSPIVKDQSEKALSENEVLSQAWTFCYSRNPDYEKVVSRSCDFLEGYLGKIYFPKDGKPQLKKFVHAFEQTPAVLRYKGDTIVDPKSNLTSLLKEASNIRGQHTRGKGRVPTKQEAEFVLHTTIYIWNLHQK